MEKGRRARGPRNDLRPDSVSGQYTRRRAVAQLSGYEMEPERVEMIIYRRRERQKGKIAFGRLKTQNGNGRYGCRGRASRTVVEDGSSGNVGDGVKIGRERREREEDGGTDAFRFPAPDFGPRY